MNCQTSKEHISQLLDNELPQELLQQLFQHLGECEECRNFFVQTKLVHDAVKNFEYSAVPKELDEKFSVLGMGEKEKSILNRKFVVSFPSAILSGILMFMISILFVLFIGDLQTKQHFTEQKFETELFKSPTLQIPYYN